MAKQDISLKQAIYKILSGGNAGSQEEICEILKKEGFEVNQSTVSRNLRRLGAVRAVRSDGQTCYRLADDSFATPTVTGGVGDLVLDIGTNGALLVIKTTPGSASLVARHLDLNLGTYILGTIAGDDTVFAALQSVKKSEDTLKRVMAFLKGDYSLDSSHA